jgi:hypothetical protein
MLRRAIAIAALVASPIAAQEPHVFVRKPGPGQASIVLAEALRQPYVLRYERWNTRLFRDSVFSSSVLVLGSSATVASTVHGDVVVVGGDLFLRPGAHIDGRAIAIGGGVYDSQQATVGRERLAFRDVHFDIVRTPDGIALDYHAPPTPEGEGIIAFPLLYGLRFPTYTRVDGLTVRWGPRFYLGNGRVTLDPTVAYRSDLGAFDPALTATALVGTGWSIDAAAERGTLTNDGWIQSDLTNSLIVLASGRDSRNYWRADRFEGRLSHTWNGAAGDWMLWAGARTERDWSVAAGGPWSITGQTSKNGIRRPNPPIERGRLSSALGGVGGSLSLETVRLSGNVTLEQAFDAPRDERFTQVTLDAGVEFPTFATQTFAVHSHAVLTLGDTAPPQRFAYLGGAGTLPTFDVLRFGGDELLYIEGMYNVPLGIVQLPLIGPPVLSLRYAIGAAGVEKLPDFEQNLGLRLSLGLLYGEFAVDPASRHTAFVVGLSTPLVR